jgi:hypothetical protein
METPKNERKSKVAFDNVRFEWLSSPLAAALLFIFAGATSAELLFAFAGATSAELANSSTINKLALKAYCSEARIESSELENGSISYKHVVELASNRALFEHPNVYHNSYAWKAKILALLDQDGDDPSQLCNRKSFELND